MLIIVDSVKFAQDSYSRVDALLILVAIRIFPFISQLIRAVKFINYIFAKNRQTLIEKIVNWLEIRNNKFFTKNLDLYFKAAKQINHIYLNLIESKLNMQLELIRYSVCGACATIGQCQKQRCLMCLGINLHVLQKKLKETSVIKCLSDIALMDMGITQIAGDTDQRGIKPLSPFYQKNVIIAFISSIFEEVQTEIWKVNYRGIISKVYIKELFLEKIRYFLKLKYFSQVYIPRTEYMDINLRSQEIPIISDSVEKNYFIVKIGRNWRAKFTIS